MFRYAVLVAIIAFGFTLGYAADAAPPAKTFGKAIALKEATPISKINSEPTKFADKEVLVSGRVSNVCQGSGCWVEVEAADSARIICRDKTDAVHFPKDCVGQFIRVQGKVAFDAKAPGKEQCKSTKKTGKKGEAAHECPAPKVMVSIEGAELQLAASSDSKIEVTPAVKVEAKVEKDTKKEEKKDDKK